MTNFGTFAALAFATLVTTCIVACSRPSASGTPAGSAATATAASAPSSARTAHLPGSTQSAYGGSGDDTQTTTRRAAPSATAK
ncbi:MAG: hypothetical protein U0174_09295 [Polyangiaceae bacterium]